MFFFYSETSEWKDIPPKLDLVHRTDVLNKTFEVGSIVDVKFEDDSSPAEIIEIDGKGNFKFSDN